MKNDSTCMPFYTNSIAGAAIQHRSDNYAFGKHLHTSMEIYLIRSGSCSMDIGSSSVRCHKGDIVMIFPNVVHSFYLLENEQCSFYHIHFFTNLFAKIIPDEDASVNLIHALLFASPSYYRQTADKETEDIIASIIRLYQSGEPSASDINARLLFLLLHLLHCCREGVPAHTKPEYQEKYVSFALNYIENNYMKKILLEDIARELHISSRYLGTLFTRYMNISPGNYINIYRINKAIELMENTSLTLTEISGRIGLKDSQHFSKLFVHIIGMTPSNYRKMFLRHRHG